MKKLLITLAIGLLACGARAESLSSSNEMLNSLQIMARNVVEELNYKWITNPFYPSYDKESGIGQGICVQYCGPANTAPPRTSGIVVSRIITDRSGGARTGEKWCLVEFGEGRPWKGYALTNLVPIACSVALKGFPPAGMKTVKAMLGCNNQKRRMMSKANEVSRLLELFKGGNNGNNNNISQ